MKTNKRITAKELDEKFDAGEDVSEHFDWDAATKRVNLDIPVWALKELDQEATRRGTTRQALIKHWLIDRLDDLRKVKAG